MLRSFTIVPADAEPGTVILSAEANEKGPRLQSVLGQSLQMFGVEIDGARVSAQTPDEHKPCIDIKETQKRFGRNVADIARGRGFGQEDAAYAAAVASAIAINEARQAVDPDIMFGVAVYGFIEGTKTASWPLDGADKGKRSGFLSRFRR